MADPILDEELVIATLKCAISPDNVLRMQAGAAQALMDLYDRKCTRDEFIALASPCLSLYGQASRLSLLDNIHKLFTDNGLGEQSFVRAEEQLTHLLRKQCESVIEIVERLKMCPVSTDKVH